MFQMHLVAQVGQVLTCQYQSERLAKCPGKNMTSKKSGVIQRIGLNQKTGEQYVTILNGEEYNTLQVPRMIPATVKIEG